MARMTLDSIAVDCPNAKEIATFYGGLFGGEAGDDFVMVRDGKVEIWFQEVEGYLPPTWPTQERGQQLHLDLLTNDIVAAAARAESLVAIRADVPRESESFLVMIDPIGHPFCLCNPWPSAEKLVSAEKKSEEVWIELGQLAIDCPDDQAEGEFYCRLLDITPDPDAGIVTDTGLGMWFQKVEAYAGPTWPTQERGQQVHIDFHTEDRDAYVAKAEELGAELQYVQDTFTVMRDPVGHPFCICDIRE